MKRSPLFLPSCLFGLLALAAGLSVASCTGAEDSGLFGASSSTPDEDAGSTEEQDGSVTTADGGTTTKDGGTTKKDGATTTEDSGTITPEAGPPDAAVGRTIGCTLDAGTKCNVGAEVCCRSAGALLGCAGGGGCTGITQLAIPCDDALDCTALGHPNELCCATIQSSGVREVACRKAADCDVSNRRNLCDPTAADPCPIGGTCKLSTQTMPGFWLCF